MTGNRVMREFVCTGRQSVLIGDDMEVTVVSIRGQSVRIGIQAPRDIPVYRKEIYLWVFQGR